MFVKICGITNPEDARASIDAGAQALGFIFHPPSPRYIPQAELAEWIERIPSSVWRVGVFVEQPAAAIEQTVRRLNLDVAQIYGSTTISEFPRGVRIWKAARIDQQIDPALDEFPAEAVLLDGPAAGRGFDWSLARALRGRLILAGGLNAENVREAIEIVQPWGVDASSSLETSPGKKDHARIARFIEACQSALSMQP